jgi:hypothetical protein
MSSTSYSCSPSTSIDGGDHGFVLEWWTHGKVPIRKHETYDGFSYNLEA